jgi:hypothetical protein
MSNDTEGQKAIAGLNGRDLGCSSPLMNPVRISCRNTFIPVMKSTQLRN